MLKIKTQLGEIDLTGHAPIKQSIIHVIEHPKEKIEDKPVIIEDVKNVQINEDFSLN